MSDRVLVRLTGLPVALRAQGYVPIEYRCMREKALNGAFPALQINSIWYFCPDDVAAIAAALRLPRAPVPTSRAA